MDDKIIVTHRGALTSKYGTKGMARIRTALTALVASDRKRGIRSRVVYLDDTVAMRKLKAKPMRTPTDRRAAKAAIDGVCRTANPDYLMILGAPDVIPHQNLANPVYSAGDDDDVHASGDLPYACDAPYNVDPARFVGPTRVVGRLPDLTGATDPSHLLTLLKTASTWRSRPAAAYADYFGLTAAVWQGSTRLSLDAVFHDDSHLRLAPPAGPVHPKGELAAGMHFINCHGAQASSEFYGQRGQRYPVSLTTKSTTGRIKEATVASVECCFGAELYDSITLGLDEPICQSYLSQGAYAYLGSTTIAYGPATENGAADLVCQYFLRNILDGASTGRAMLMARQKFVGGSSQMDPIDLKTLAQFCLLGDPSVHPVSVSGATTGAKGMDLDATERFQRGERRAKLRQVGVFLQKTKPTASRRQPGVRTSPTAKAALANIAKKSGLPAGQAFTAYKVKGAPVPRKGVPAKLASAPSRYYLAVGTPKTRADHAEYGMMAVIAKEVGGRIIDYRIYHRR